MSLGNVHITPQLVQAVRDAVDVVALASEHTRLRKAGRRWQGLCPLHKEKTPSFSVDPVAGLFYCFGCGAGGDAIKLHMLATGDDFPAAIEALAGRYGIPLPSRETRAGGRTERDLEGALQAASEFFRDQLRNSAFAQEYLEKKREIPSELIDRFGLGYAPDGWRNLIGALKSRVALADLEAAGLIARSDRGGEPYDRFRNRLMFPIHSASGTLLGFGGRTMGDDKAKYINTNETERFHKGHLLYGLHLAKKDIRESGRAVLCEGYFDVISAVACGMEGSIAGMGTALTPEQAKQLSRYAEEVVVAYDGDNAGESAFERALPILLAEGLRVRRASFPGGHDPDSFRLAAGPEAVAEAVREAEDAIIRGMRKKITGPVTPQKRAALAVELSKLVEPIPDPLVRLDYGRVAAGMLEISEKEFLSLLKNSKGWQAVADAKQRTSISSTAAADRAEGGLSWNIEKLVLALLLEAAEPVPPAEDLPPPEAFLDPGCRNIYQTWCDLYARGSGSPPDAKAVLAEIGAEGGAVDQMAGILLERNITSGRLGLLESLEKLEDRWRKQRSRELAGKIREAELRKDSVRLQSLLEEKSRLSQGGPHRGFRWSREGI